MSAVFTIDMSGETRLERSGWDFGEAQVYAGGGGDELMASVRRYQTAIVARGRIFVAGDNSLYAFKP